MSVEVGDTSGNYSTDRVHHIFENFGLAIEQLIIGTIFLISVLVAVC